MKSPVPAAWPAASVKLWPLERILPYDKNPRQHSPEQVDLIAKSMAEDGVTSPILVDEHGVIIYGHGRRMAAEKNGFTQYPVIVAKDWTEQQKRAYRIKDNSLALLSTWSTDLLRVELGELSTAGYDMPLLGFQDIDLVSFMSMPRTDDPEQTPDIPEKAVTRRGDIWILGRHRVMCGNSVDVSDVRRLLNGTVPALANCDPPYGISIVSSSSTDGGAKPFGKVGGGKPHPFKGKNLGREHGPARNAIIKPGVYAPIIGDDSTDTAIKSYEVLAALGVPVIVMWGGNYYANALPASRCWLVWDKENTGSFADAELAWTNQDSIVRLLRHQWSGLIKESERGERRVHPTQKPVALAEWVIETLAPKGKTAVDLFLGSGSTLIACERKNVACFGMEMSENYCDVVINRWEIFAKGEAVLDGDGRTFSQIKAARMKKAPSAKPGAKAGKSPKVQLAQ